MTLSIIIVNYNVKYFIEQALLSVQRACVGIDTEIIVVDNNSVDGSVEMLRTRFPSIHLIENADNPGFAKANNQALDIATGKYVLLLNPDTVVEENTFHKCVEFLDNHPDAGALGVKMIDGSGAFLPESKRGFPTPFVAFCKAFGLSRLFPKSKVFNRYHLGYLDKEKTHIVDVLSGAFMMIRTNVLDTIGYLDENFFMYGEDIDLSYRIQESGYANYYFADTKIIHYKGESTKKGSLNYVRTFYQAMIIFARKHFKGSKSSLLIAMLSAAIYVRAFLTIAGRLVHALFLPLIDAAVIFGGMYFLKDFWAHIYFNDPNYYQDTFMLVNVPLYIVIWLASVYFSGGYDAPFLLRRLVRGLLFGTLILAAVYGFLDLSYRPSRALIIFGLIWAIIGLTIVRVVLHVIRYGHMNIGRERSKNMVIAGTKTEGERVLNLLYKAGVTKNFIGFVGSDTTTDKGDYLSPLQNLEELTHIYKIDEIIFCSQDIATQDILNWMTRLGPAIDYKIVPKEGMSIIGSSSKNIAGELYTIDLRFRIAIPRLRRDKRILDISVSFILILLFPILIWNTKYRSRFLKCVFPVLAGKMTWVSYAHTPNTITLPTLKMGVLSPKDALRIHNLDDTTLHRLNFLYARDYTWQDDAEIIWKCLVTPK